MPDKADDPAARPAVTYPRRILDDRCPKRDQVRVSCELVLEKAERARHHQVVGIPEDYVRGGHRAQAEIASCAQGNSFSAANHLSALDDRQLETRGVVHEHEVHWAVLLGDAGDRLDEPPTCVGIPNGDNDCRAQLPVRHCGAVSSSTMTNRSEPRRITRIIARLNIGGPAIQAITLTSELEAYGYRTRLVRGVEDSAEGNMDYLAEERGVVPTLIPTMRRNPGLGDLAALTRLVFLMWRDRPAVVHTHAAKAGTLGRVATLLAFPLPPMRPKLVHTYHGHSLTGYFSGRSAGIYRLIEKVLASQTDVLLAVSAEVRDDLVQLGVASPGKFRVMPLGFDLSPFTDDMGRDERRRALRAAWGIRDEDIVVTLIARLVPIKRVDRFLAVARMLADRSGVKFVIVGDGELREELGSNAGATELGEQLVWAGFRRDIPDVCFASDIVMLTSDNEGTPVSLIEAQAAAVPIVATDVGGVRSAVRPGESGFLAAASDVDAIAAAVCRLLDDAALRARMAAAGRAHATSLYTLGRLAADHAALYDELVESGQRPRPR